MESKKDLSKPLRLNRAVASAGIIRSVSSAYCIIGYSPPKVFTNWILQNSNMPGSVDNRLQKVCCEDKEEGGKRITLSHPPLHWKLFPGMPFNNTEEDPDCKIIWIHLTHLVGNHLCAITYKITWCLILSKAFSKSSFKIMTSFWSDGRCAEIERPKLDNLGWFFL